MLSAATTVIGIDAVLLVAGIVKVVIVGGVVSRVMVTVELAPTEIFPAASLAQA